MTHPEAATHAINAVGISANFTIEPGHATAAILGLPGDSLVEWAAARVPFWQKEIPVVNNGHYFAIAAASEKRNGAESASSLSRCL